MNPSILHDAVTRARLFANSLVAVRAANRSHILGRPDAQGEPYDVEAFLTLFVQALAQCPPAERLRIKNAMRARGIAC